jgi:hypothetical protein
LEHLLEMTYDLATPIELTVWKDPQNYVIPHHVRDEAWVYFRCWETAGELAEYVGCLHFEGVWHVGSRRFTKTRGYPNILETTFYSYYLCVEDSSLLKSLIHQRTQDDPGWEKYDHRKYQHYIVESHDFYINIIAGKVRFTTINGEKARPHFDMWENV